MGLDGRVRGPPFYDGKKYMYTEAKKHLICKVKWKPSGIYSTSTYVVI